MAETVKRRRNTRPATYRPRTQAQKERRQALWDARADDRRQGQRLGEEARLKLRLDDLETALRDSGRGGIHNDRHTIPLDEIEDDDHRFHVLKARVERLEALWSITLRKRVTRGKIIIGGALLAEISERRSQADGALLALLVDILVRRVDRVRDRLTVRDLLGDTSLPLRPGGDASESVEDALKAAGETLPDFDAQAQTAMTEDPDATYPAHEDDLEAA